MNCIPRNKNEFEGWVHGVFGEGIALAIANLDRRKEGDWDSLGWASIVTESMVRVGPRQSRQNKTDALLQRARPPSDQVRQDRTDPRNLLSEKNLEASVRNPHLRGYRHDEGVSK